MPDLLPYRSQPHPPTPRRRWDANLDVPGPARRQPVPPSATPETARRPRRPRWRDRARGIRMSGMLLRSRRGGRRDAGRRRQRPHQASLAAM